MEIQISGQGFEVTKPIEEHIHQKLKKIEKHFNHIESVHIVLKIEKDLHIAEATVHISHRDISVRAKSEDMYISTDLLVRRLDRKIIKHKEKLKDHHSKEMVHHNLKAKKK